MEPWWSSPEGHLAELEQYLYVNLRELTVRKYHHSHWAANPERHQYSSVMIIDGDKTWRRGIIDFDLKLQAYFHQCSKQATKQSAWHGIWVGGSCEVANIASWLRVFSKEKFVHNLRVKALKVSWDVLKMMLLSLVQGDLFCQAAVTTQSSESAHALYWTYSLSASIFIHFLGGPPRSWGFIYVTVISVSGYLLISPLLLFLIQSHLKNRTLQ